MNKIKGRLLYFATMTLLLTAGCSNKSALTGSNPGATRASLFVTDNLSIDYDHVWAKIKKVELNQVGGGSSVVFEDPAGVTLDLRSLRDQTGKRFKFLATTANLSGEFDGITVTLDENVVLYPNGQTSGLTRVFAGSVSGEKTLTASIAPARSFNDDNDHLILDFDLSKWNENGTEVTDAEVLVSNDEDGLHDRTRHDQQDYPGIVSDLQGTAPNQTFTLTRHNMTMSVSCDATTRLYRSGGDGNPVLENGQHVEVRGTFSLDTHVLNAAKVKIQERDSEDAQEAKGNVSSLDIAAFSFTLDVKDADHFLPASNPITVTASDATKYRDHSGTVVSQAEFFAALAVGANVEVEGSYASDTNTFSAVQIKLDDEDKGHESEGASDNPDSSSEDNGSDSQSHESEPASAGVSGATSNVDAEASTFTVTIVEFSGFNIAPDVGITIKTVDSTIYRGTTDGHEELTKAEFFAALSASPGKKVEIEGTWDGSILTAQKCKLRD